MKAVYVNEEYFKKIKIEAATTGKKIQDIIEETMNLYFNNKGNKKWTK